MTPLMYQLSLDGVTGNFSGNDLYIGKIVNAVRRYVPRVICNCSAVAGTDLQIRSPSRMQL